MPGSETACGELSAIETSDTSLCLCHAIRDMIDFGCNFYSKVCQTENPPLQMKIALRRDLEAGLVLSHQHVPELLQS